MDSVIRARGLAKGYALRGGPLGAGLPVTYAWMPLAAAAAVLVPLPLFARRDVAAHWFGGWCR